MIPILYALDEITFTSFGLGALSDCVSCTVTEERNGEYTMAMTYPIDGANYDQIVPGSPIKCKLEDYGDSGDRGWQVFRVVKMSRPLNGIVTIEAEHVSYQLSLIPVAPFTASNVGAALSNLASHAAVACPFTFSTDKTTSATFAVTEPSSMRSRLGGSAGSILDVYGGEWEFDNFGAVLWASRGANRGVVIRYGVNLSDLEQEENIAKTVTGIFPYWAKDDVLVVLPEQVINSANAANFPFPRVVPVNFAKSIKTQPTEAELRTAATAYVSQAGVGVPQVSLHVEFVNLADTLEFSGQYNDPEIVRLCDTVTVKYERLNVSTTAKIVKTVYDVLAERYESLEVGDIRTTLADTISGAASNASKAATMEDVEDAVATKSNAFVCDSETDLNKAASSMTLHTTATIWISATCLNTLTGHSAQGHGVISRALSGTAYITIVANGTYLYMINYNINTHAATYKMLTAS